MQHSSLQRKAKDALTKNPCEKKQVKQNKLAKTPTNNPAQRKTGLQQIEEQCRKISEQITPSFFNGATEATLAPGEDNSGSIMQKESE